ncbi:hypothetical protein GCM10010193_28180 [Kitasatospora atroaurantiaca]|uniref:DUF6545 domain-containing protein n=1 Tax=Kitasatospora atroaurantiaca TaxID=285545 RepID=A0A561EJU8_9ACTN|nr:MAB_1171c family putative transporter [Kitasatospora atroaurantiaca]TWE15888.1 hypothetical protein FB465_0836 [Kitasatospora atroaurantiaca]
MTTLLHPPCAIVAWMALLYKLAALRRAPRDPALIALCAVLAFSALSFTLSIPTVWLHLDRWAGIPDIAALLAQSCVMALVGSQQLLLSFWLAPRQQAVRLAVRRLPATVAVLTAMVVLFSLMAPAEQHPVDFTLRYAQDPYYAAYLLLYIAAYTAGEAEVGLRCWRYARISNRRWLQRGLRTTAVGAWTTLGYSAVRIADLTAAQLGLDLHRAETVAWVCGDLGALLTLVGWTLPGWGPRLTAAHRGVRHYLHYQRLYPLWRALHRANPTIALEPSRSALAGLLTVRNLEFRLYRRVIEIRDGQLALRSHHDAEAADAARHLCRAAGLSGDRLRATVVAAQIGAALRAKELGLPAAGDSGGWTTDGPESADLTDEVLWLTLVSTAFRRSPVVAAATAVTEVREQRADRTT